MSSVIAPGLAQLQCALDFLADSTRRFPRGLDDHICLTVEGKSLLVQTRELFEVIAQRTLGSVGGFVLEAALPEFGDGRIQKDRRPGAQQLAVCLLNKCAAAERYDAVAGQGVRQIAQGIGFSGTEGVLSMKAKNIRNGLALAGFDASIEIDKVPGEAAGEFLSDGAFAGTHEAHKKHGAHSHGDYSDGARRSKRQGDCPVSRQSPVPR